MNKGVIITQNRNTTHLDIKFLDFDSRHKFIDRVYMDRHIPPVWEKEKVADLLKRVVAVDVYRTFVKLSVSKYAIRDIFDREPNEDIVEISVDLDGIPFIYKTDSYADFRNIKVNQNESILYMSEKDIDMEDYRKRAFANELERTARTFFDEN